VRAVSRDQLNLVGFGVYGPRGAVDKALKRRSTARLMTKPKRRWTALVIPTPGAEPEEVDVDASTEREARENAHAEAITLYGRRARIVSIEQRAGDR
jgi:hypothetical protein